MKWFLFLAFAFSCSAAEPLTVPLWPEGAPSEMATPSPATTDLIQKKAGTGMISNISSPTLVVYRPDKPNGTSVIVAPGGAYAFLAAIHEGSQVCEWLNSIGVTGILLNYRTPTRDETAPHEKPVQDAQRALEIIRQHAGEWKLNPKRIGLLGFSAGGNLLAHLACDRDLKNYPHSHNKNALSPRPDFGIMIYGGGFLDPADPMKLKSGFSVPPDAPPMFLACASDDGGNPVAATLLYLEYKKQELPMELHLFSKGGHGFGMRNNGHPINDWPTRCAEWMDSNGWLPTVEKLDAGIQRQEVDLKALAEKVKALGCGNDAMEMIARIKSTEAQLAQTTPPLDREERAQLQGDLKNYRAAAEILKQQLSKTTIKPEEVVNDINRLKKNIAELQSEREWLTKNLDESSAK